MSEETSIKQGIILLFVVTTLLTGVLIVEHSRVAIIPLLIAVVCAAYSIHKLNEKENNKKKINERK